MKNLKKYFNNIAPILIGAITLDGYRRTVINDLNIKETDKLVQETVRKSIEIANKLNDTLEQKLNEDVEIQANLGKVKESIENMEHNAKILNNLSQNNENNQTLINERSKTFKESASKANKLIDKLLDIINNNSGSNNYMQNIFDNINNFLNSLTSIQLGAVGHIFACISILYCL
jgi:methyl-accepting chemotaxis protein